MLVIAANAGIGKGCIYCSLKQISGQKLRLKLSADMAYISSLYLVGTTKEHLGLAMALKVPTFVIVNKTDICLPAMVERTLRVLERLLKTPGCNKVPVVVKTEDDVIVAATNFTSNQ